jgi:hypothetical protein
MREGSGDGDLRGDCQAGTPGVERPAKPAKLTAGKLTPWGLIKLEAEGLRSIVDGWGSRSCSAGLT